MRTVARCFVVALCAVAVVSLGVVTGGCGEDGSEGASAGDESGVKQWERVTTAQISGEQPVRMYLGAHELGDQLRVAWVLSGPKDPPVTLTLRLINVATGSGLGQAVTSQSVPGGIDRRDDEAISLRQLPGEYRIYFSQRFRPANGPGYDLKLTIYTK